MKTNNCTNNKINRQNLRPPPKGMKNGKPQVKVATLEVKNKQIVDKKRKRHQKKKKKRRSQQTFDLHIKQATQITKPVHPAVVRPIEDVTIMTTNRATMTALDNGVITIPKARPMSIQKTR